MAAKNLGQVAGLFIGTIAPTNHALIWYDTVTHVHKTYDVSLNSWVVLDPRYITAITYSGLVSRAAGDGLTQGQWYKIIDKGNVLAIAITATKVQYANNNGVLVIDDLGTHIIYSVTSENLIIDDVTGVYDANTNKLVFSFAETTPELNTGDTNVDYVFGEQKRGTSKTLKKFRISSFLSTVTGNDITWNGGFFFNFYSKLITYFDVNGGIVSKTAFEQFKVLNNQAIAGISDTITSATSASQIYGKQLPNSPTIAEATDIVQYDTLQTIVFKVQRWINQFKYASGSQLPWGYEPWGYDEFPETADSVSTAIAKLDRYVRKHETGDGIIVTREGSVPGIQGMIYPTDAISLAIKKLVWMVGHIGTTDIVDGSITSVKLATDAVTSDKINQDAITTNKILDGAVTENKIGSEAISTTKIADRAVTRVKMALNSVGDEILDDKNKPVLISGKQTYNTVDVDIICTQLLTKTMLHWTVPVIEVDEGIELTIQRGSGSLNLDLYPYSFFVLVKLVGASGSSAELIIDNTFSGFRIKAGGSGTAETKYCRVTFIRDTDTSHYYAVAAEEITGWLKSQMI